MWGKTAVLVLALSGVPCLAQDTPQEEEEVVAPRGVSFRFKRRPSLRFGKWLRVDFRVKIQTDFRDFTPDTGDDMFELHRARVSVEGNFLNKMFEYEVEREVRGNLPTIAEPKHVWRDAYVNFRHFRRLQIKGGKFKEPFGREQLTGPTRLDFIYRSLISKYLTPARDVGVMAHGRLFRRGLNYEMGLFNQDGENAHAKDDATTGERTVAGRLTGTPLRLLPLPAALQSLEVGGAFTTANVREGLNGLRGRNVAEHTIFQHIDVNGRRLRLGSELDWNRGPLSLKGEFIHVQEQRLSQGLLGQDLPDLISRGWYLTGAWVLTGEDKAGGVQPKRRIGAVEAAGRYEQVRFGSSEHFGLPSRSPRAANILPNSDRVLTLGVNWYVNPWVKIQFNAIREKIEDIQRTPVAGQDRFWLAVCRLQFVM